MMSFAQRLERLAAAHEALLDRPNAVDENWSNGLFERYRHPVLTAAHAPLFWRYDLDEQSNPFLMERLMSDTRASGRHASTPRYRASSPTSRSRCAVASTFPTGNVHAESPQYPLSLTPTSTLTTSPSWSLRRLFGIPCTTSWLIEMHEFAGKGRGPAPRYL